MTEDVGKSFFDVIAQLKEIDPDAYYKVLKGLGTWWWTRDIICVFLIERSKKNFKSKKRIERRIILHK